MAELCILTGAMQGMRHSLAESDMVIGRHSQDISLPDDMVSRRHARITFAGGAYMIEDLGSRNGIFVNDKRVDRRMLQHGDKIMIGGSILEFRDEANPAPAPPSTDADGVNPLRRTYTLDASEKEVLSSEEHEVDLLAIQRARADLSAIYQAGQIITSTLNISQIYARILDIVFKELPHADAVSIHMLQGSDGSLICKGNRRRGNPANDEQIIFSSSMSNFVLRERKSMLTLDAINDGKFNSNDSIVSFHICSSLCAPLISGNRLLGVIQANTLNPAHKFDRDDLRLITAFGLQAGAALDNSMLYERLVADKAELQSAHEKLRLAQETLVHSEKLAAVGRLAAGIVHDIKNPLTVILSHAELLEMSLKNLGIENNTGFNPAESLNEIQQGVMHCNKVVNQLLHFSRQSEPCAILLNINELVNSTLSFLSHEIKKNRIAVDLDMAKELPPVMADPNQLKQVLLNIIINAIQAMEADKGRLFITTRVAPDNAGTVETLVEDNGMGMTEEVQRRLFEPFFSTKEANEGLGGTGLGLAISYGIIKNHGGAIHVSSSPGKGSSFIISLPQSTARGA